MRIPFMWGIVGLLISISQARADYSFATFDLPQGVGGTRVLGINNGSLVGDYIDANGSSHGFSDVGGVVTTLDDPSATLGTHAEAISGNIIIGGYTSSPTAQFPGGVGHGFTYNQSQNSYATIDDPSATWYTSPYAIDGNTIVGGWSNASSHGPYGFIYDGNNWSTLDFAAGSEGVVATGISNGTVAGYYRDGSGVVHGFTYNQSRATYTMPIEDPEANNTSTGDVIFPGTIIFGINDDVLSGDYLGADNLPHGFIDITGTFTTIDDPFGVGGTYVNATSGSTVIVGYYLGADNLNHGFVATVPEPSAFFLTGILAAGVMGRRPLKKIARCPDLINCN